jgi:Ca2+:H+ antiporter
MSHGVAVLLLVLYLGYLIFQMWSHAVSFLLFLSLLESDGQDLYTDEETSLSTAYPAEIRDQVNEKLNIKRRIRYRRNRKQGITEDLESNSTHSDGSPSGEGSGSRVVAKEEEEEELPQMSITATIVSQPVSCKRYLVRECEKQC